MPRYFYMCSITIDADNEDDAYAMYLEQTKDLDICLSEMEEAGEDDE